MKKGNQFCRERQKIFVRDPCSPGVRHCLQHYFLERSWTSPLKEAPLLKYTYVGDLDEQSVSDFIGQQLGMEVEVQLSSNDLTKDTNLLTVTATEDISLEQSTALDEALTAQYPDQQLVLSNSNSLNPSMGRLFFIKCLVAILLASIFLVIYVALRFRKIGGWTAGVMAVWRCLTTYWWRIFAFVVFQIPLNDNFVAVVLSILGYSLNDTIVIYDRFGRTAGSWIAMFHCRGGQPQHQPVLYADPEYQYLGTFIAIATVAVVGLIFNLDSIISFAVPMMFGVISGFYTSVFLCSPPGPGGSSTFWIKTRPTRRRKKDPPEKQKA